MVQNLFLPVDSNSTQDDMTIRILVISDNPAVKDSFPAEPGGPGAPAAGRRDGGANTAFIFTSYQDAAETATRTSPHVLLAEIGGADDAAQWQTAAELKKNRRLPLIAFMPAAALDTVSLYPGYDDFVIMPCNSAELLFRISRLVKNDKADNPELIKCDDLIIDTATCEVTVDGVKVDLTFKEYELLKLLAASKGRVFTREALLDKIWGYDYFGGDRTVDVHVRRLRSKIEDAAHSYIETVRNIGYKFIKNM
jgi:two-component system, OmpR family, alkaline phosphatase synthesis response regulator PhoP